MKIHFLGANRQVTGSRYLLEAAGKRVMVDCGLFQERCCQQRNWEPTPVDPKQIDVLLLTHAHLDHCGLLPRLHREGFRGRVITTVPSMELAEIVMTDSARIHEEDVEYKKKRHKREGRKSPHPYEPLYTRRDAENVAELLEGTTFDTPVELGPGLQATFREAGHILGSSLLEIDVEEAGRQRRIVFSGDLGQPDTPIVGDPTPVAEADYVIMESTYGDKDHDRPTGIEDQLADVVNDTLDRGGNLLIPTFAIERAQELMLHLARVVYSKRAPRVMSFLDSPMAINVTEVFLKYPEFMDEQTQQALRDPRVARTWEWFKFTRRRNESMAINSIRGTCIILAGSGMCTGGRIKHHLVQNIERTESTILFVGYQGRHTLGREILDGNPRVRIFGKQFDVRAKVRQIQGLSAHAGRDDLLDWLGALKRPPRKLMLTHGEEDTALQLAETVRGKFGFDVVVPEYLETLELD